MQDEFGWSKYVQGQLLGSFFIGYAVMMPAGGMIVSNFSAGYVHKQSVVASGD